MTKVTIQFDDVDEAHRFIGGMLTKAAPANEQFPMPPSVAETVQAAKSDGEVDVHGMPWDEEIHATTKKKNADGSWKVRKGKADEAKAAIADFKAAGGTIDPPADVQTPVATMPGTAPAAPAAPAAMPGARAAKPPVSYEDLVAKCGDMISRGVTGLDDVPLGTENDDTFGKLYDQFGVDRSNPADVLTTNESARRGIFDALDELDD